MTKKFKIKVTKDDIKNGKPWKKMSCPIALAIKRVFPGSYVKAGMYIVITDFKKDGTRKLWEFMDKFDTGKKVKPFDFVIEVNDKKCPKLWKKIQQKHESKN